jgi:hypothetical protein
MRDKRHRLDAIARQSVATRRMCYGSLTCTEAVFPCMRRPRWTMELTAFWWWVTHIAAMPYQASHR